MVSRLRSLMRSSMMTIALLPLAVLFGIASAFLLMVALANLLPLVREASELTKDEEFYNGLVGGVALMTGIAFLGGSVTTAYCVIKDLRRRRVR